MSAPKDDWVMLQAALALLNGAEKVVLVAPTEARAKAAFDKAYLAASVLANPQEKPDE